jgi:hypothetical protein
VTAAPTVIDRELRSEREDADDRYYMARPYRVIHVLQRKGEVVVRRERAYPP